MELLQGVFSEQFTCHYVDFIKLPYVRKMSYVILSFGIFFYLFWTISNESNYFFFDVCIYALLSFVPLSP